MPFSADYETADGHTPLLSAIRSSQPKHVAKVVVEIGADVNMRLDSTRESCLLTAVKLAAECRDDHPQTDAEAAAADPAPAGGDGAAAGDTPVVEDGGEDGDAAAAGKNANAGTDAVAKSEGEAEADTAANADASTTDGDAPSPPGGDGDASGDGEAGAANAQDADGADVPPKPPPPAASRKVEAPALPLRESMGGAAEAAEAAEAAGATEKGAEKGSDRDTTGHRHELGKDNMFGDINDPSFTQRLSQGQRFELIVTMLVEYGADITLLNSSGESPLMIAAHYGLPMVAKALTKTDAELRSALEAKDMQCIHCGLLHVMEWDRLHCGPDVVALHKSPNGEFLTSALNTAYKQIIDGVMQGALFPLMEAARRGHFDVIKVYVAAGADPHAHDGAGRSILFYACEGQTVGHVAAVAFLCGECGVDVNHTAANGETALMQSARLGYGKHVGALLSFGADASMTDATAHDARAIASLEGEKAHEALEALLAMENAVLTNDFETVLTMVKRGNYPIDYTISRPNSVEEGGPSSFSLITPLMRACEVGATAAVGDMIAMGANVNAAPDDDGINGLMMSAIVGHAEAAKLLLDNGASVDQGEARGLTSLHLAALYGHDDFVCVLVQDYAASINMKSKSGNTALSCASLKGNLGVVDALVSLGAFVTAANNKGLTPLDLARSQGHRSVGRIQDERPMTCRRFPTAAAPTTEPQPQPQTDPTPRLPTSTPHPPLTA